MGVGIGSVLALASGLTELGERLIDPVMHMFRTMPVLALLPLFIIWFGIGEEAKVFLIAWAVMFPIYINLFAGIKSVDPKLLEAGRVLGLQSPRSDPPGDPARRDAPVPDRVCGWRWACPGWCSWPPRRSTRPPALAT